VSYCGGGIAASADAMVLVMLGHPDVKLNLDSDEPIFAFEALQVIDSIAS
jgi:hypothetical protein